MKDYRVLFSYEAILLSVGFVIRSIAFTYAYPTGPNVSMGSNPLVVINGTKSSGVMHTVPSDKTLVITDVYIRNAS